MVDFSFSTSELEYFLLIFIRMTAFMYLAPFYGDTSIPSRFKVALSIFLAYLVYMTTEPVELVYDTVFEYALLVLKEVVVGLLIGLAAGICMHIVAFAGRIIDMEIGLSAASLMDPTFHDNVTVSGMFLKYIFSLLLITSGMYQYIIKALIETYTLIPINGAKFAIGNIMSTMLSFMTQYFVIGFQIALPVFAVIMVMNAVLAILAKVAPQMNLFAVGMQIKILSGFAVLYLSMWLVPIASELLFKEMKRMIVAMVEAMM